MEVDNTRVYELYSVNKELVLNMSQFGDDRPLSTIRASMDGRYIASGSLNPIVKVWDSVSLSCQLTLRGHQDRIASVAWKPPSSNAQSELLASTSADGTCVLWDCRSLHENIAQSADYTNMETEEAIAPPTSATLMKARFDSHKGVVAAASFHPYMNTLATACHDFAWRLFDLETQQEILLQDGHIKECTGIAFHPDGSLAMSTDSGGVALLWDLRSGQMIQGFQGHMKKISSCCFNAHGFQVATGSLDNTVKIWDLRKRKCGYTLPAHSNIISDIAYSTSGEVLMTASFDGTVKVWGARDFQILRTLTGHSGKIMAADLLPDEKHIISAGFDRTIKLWAHKDEF